MIEVAVVILNYNGSHFLQQFLPSVLQHSGTAKIIVADNGSSDDSLVVLQKFPTVEIIAIGENLGFCGGYNFALKQVAAKYYVLLNSDIEVTPDWINPMVKLMNRDDSIAAVQPKILSYHQRSHFEYAGASGGFLDALAYPFCRGRIFDQTEEDNGQYNHTAQVFWATGACLFVRAEAFHQVGGLDEDFFAHMEEIDLCWKFNRIGLKVFCEPQSTIYHVGGGTLSKANPKKTYLNFRNGLSLMFKHLSPASLYWKFPVRILLDWVAALKFALGSNFRDSQMVIKAHVNFFTSWGRERSKRAALHSLGYKVSPRITFPKMIVVEYYLKGIRTFRNLRF